MKKFKKIIRGVLFALMIVLAAIIPFPIPVFHRDKAPKYITEQVDRQEDEDEEDEEDERT